MLAIPEELAQAVLNHFTSTPHVYLEVKPFIDGLVTLKPLEAYLPKTTDTKPEEKAVKSA